MKYLTTKQIETLNLIRERPFNLKGGGGGGGMVFF